MGLFNKDKTEDNIEEETPKILKKKEDSFSSLSSYGVIISPIVTEKSHNMSQNGKYLFKVSSIANKNSIKRAIEEMYKINVEKVNVLTVSNKKRTIKYDRGYQKSYRKAIITLKKGQHITVFEGV